MSKSMAGFVRECLRLQRDARVDVRPHAFSTSAPLFAIEVDGPDAVRLILKDLNPRAMLNPASAVKPAWLIDPMREISVYEQALPVLPPGPPRLVGRAVDPADDRWWLLLERVAGTELWQVGELSAWMRVAEWLAGLHEAARSAPPPPTATSRLVLRDRAFHDRFLARAEDHVHGRRIERVRSALHRAEELLADQVPHLIHGEAYPSNVLVADDRIAFVDWEMCSVGVGLTDIAALTAGQGWSPAEKAQIISAYRGGQPDADYCALLDAAALQLAVQWLGWAPDWSPPREHAQDWLSVAVGLSGKVLAA